MAKITALDEALVLTGDEHLPIVQGTDTKRATMGAFRDLITPFLQYWYKGDRGFAGPSNNTRAAISDLKAAEISDLSSLYDGSLWVWTPADFSRTPEKALDRIVVESDHAALTQGAWIRSTPIVDIRNFGAQFDDYNDDTDAWAAAIAYLTSIGGGALQLPQGISRVTEIEVPCLNSIPVNLIGPGARACYVRRIGTGTNALLRCYSGVPGEMVEPYFLLRGFTLLGGALTNGASLQIEDVARIRLDEVHTIGGSVGIDLQGCLTSDLVKCSTNGAQVGTRARAKIVHPNALTFTTHESRGNTQWGIDYGDGEALSFVGRHDISANGGAADLVTGGVIVRNTAGKEIGFGQADLSGMYLERNIGWGLYVEDAPGLHIFMSSGGFYGNDNGQAAFIGKIASFSAEDLIAGASTDRIIVEAQVASLRRGVIAFPEMRGANWERRGVQTFLGVLNDNKGLVYHQLGGSNQLLEGPSNLISNGASNSYDSWLYGSGTRRFFGNGKLGLELGDGRLGLYGTPPVEQQAVQGALSSITDVATRTVLENVIRALSAFGAIRDETT